MNDNKTEQDKAPDVGLKQDGGSMGSAESEGAQVLTDLEGEAPLSSVLTAPADSDSEEENDEPADAASEKPIPERALDDARIAELLANPMFIRFARGRSGGIEAICREFEDMLAAGGKAPVSRMAAPVAAKIVPTSAAATPDVALSERQRAIARTAGMSYREYYELISELPGSNHQNYKGE